MPWRSIFLLGGGATLVLFAIATVVSIFSTVNYEDALIQAKWISSRGLSHPTPGSLYVLTEDGLHGRPICRLNITKEHLVGSGDTRKYIFSNVVGNTMTFLADINAYLFNLGKESEKPFSPSVELVWVADEIYVRSFRDVPMDEGCRADFDEAIQNGEVICTVDRAIVAPGDDKMVYAIGFRSTCASSCATGEKNCEAPKFMAKQTYGWSTMLKNEIGLVRLVQAPMTEAEQVRILQRHDQVD